MNEIILIIIAIALFFFGYEIRPWFEKKPPLTRHLVDLMTMAVTVTTVLIPLISLISSGDVVVGSYFIVVFPLTGYLIYYVIKHYKELQGKSRKVFVCYAIIYCYIFIASSILIVMVAHFMPNIKL